jgi:hypothetical protein
VVADVERFSLSTLVEETLDGLRGVVRSEDVELRAVLPDGMAPIATDPSKLKQILINLVGNAIKFTQEGAVTVQVHADAETGRPERIEVRDTGVGIPQDRLEAIFGAFEQADTGTARRFGGTGLGLTIVSSLSELPRLPDRGGERTGGRLHFPLCCSHQTRPSPPQPRPPPCRTTGPIASWPSWRPGIWSSTVGWSSSSTDDTDSRILLTHQLEEGGARTIAASTGELGIRMAREFRPDIILLDLLLPGMTGVGDPARPQVGPGASATFRS